MKKLLVLGGGSERNRVWGEACSEAYRDDFDTTFFIHYEHWSTGEKNIDFDAEIEKIKETVEGSGEDVDWFIFAKSIGSVLTMKAVMAGVIKPDKCVFFGMPLNIAETILAGDWSFLESFKVPTLAFHNDNDPIANYEFTQNSLNAKAPQVILESLKGETHDYSDFELYRSQINKFL